MNLASYLQGRFQHIKDRYTEGNDRHLVETTSETSSSILKHSPNALFELMRLF